MSPRWVASASRRRDALTSAAPASDPASPISPASIESSSAPPASQTLGDEAPRRRDTLPLAQEEVEQRDRHSQGEPEKARRGEDDRHRRSPSSAASRHLLPASGEKDARDRVPLAPRSGERVAEGRVRGAPLMRSPSATQSRRPAAPARR